MIKYAIIYPAQEYGILKKILKDSTDAHPIPYLEDTLLALFEFNIHSLSIFDSREEANTANQDHLPVYTIEFSDSKEHGLKPLNTLSCSQIKTLSASYKEITYDLSSRLEKRGKLDAEIKLITYLKIVYLTPITLITARHNQSLISYLNLTKKLEDFTQFIISLIGKLPYNTLLEVMKATNNLIRCPSHEIPYQAIQEKQKAPSMFKAIAHHLTLAFRPRIQYALTDCGLFAIKEHQSELYKKMQDLAFSIKTHRENTRLKDLDDNTPLHKMTK